MCLTLGGALLVLSFTETATGRLVRVLRTFGQVPFFYYRLPFLLLSAAAWVWTTLTFGRAINLAFAKVPDWPAAYAPSLGRAYLVGGARWGWSGTGPAAGTSALNHGTRIGGFRTCKASVASGNRGVRRVNEQNEWQ